MKLLQAKLAKYTAPQEAKAAGVYPYFRAISSVFFKFLNKEHMLHILSRKYGYS